MVKIALEIDIKKAINIAIPPTFGVGFECQRSPFGGSTIPSRKLTFLVRGTRTRLKIKATQKDIVTAISNKIMVLHLFYQLGHSIFQFPILVLNLMHSQHVEGHPWIRPIGVMRLQDFLRFSKCHY